MITTEDAKVLIDLARKVIKAALRGETVEIPQWIKERYSQPAGVFVTLKKGGQVEGLHRSSLSRYAPLEGDRSRGPKRRL